MTDEDEDIHDVTLNDDEPEQVSSVRKSSRTKTAVLKLNISSTKTKTYVGETEALSQNNQG